MSITVETYSYNIIQSIYYFLNNETYTKSSTTKTLKGHFSDPQLDIVLGFPPALNEIVLPTVALVLQPLDAKNVTAYANQYDQIIYPFNLYGFCGGEQSFEANQKQRDLLCSDLRTLLEETDYINIFTVSDTPVASDFVTTKLSQVYTSGSTLYVDSTSGFASSGTAYLSATAFTYTSLTSATFLGCSGLVAAAKDTIVSRTLTVDVLVQNVISRNLNPTGILVADRYRFLIEFETVYFRSIAHENS